jgi:pimeloyl-ACP methyl ester carboxylesterase
MATSYRINGLLLTEHELDVPLDHADPAGETITVFARVIDADDGKDRPYLVYFQGGPGSEAVRPQPPLSGAWERALKDYRVVMLDQRGTGRSTPVSTLPGRSPEEQAEYLAHHRADAIVRDAEALRQHLGVDRWSVLGQSFGGFCVTTYLSFAPQGLREAFLTGGLPPVGRHTDDVYRLTYERVLERTRRYYARYPSDRARMRALRGRLEAEDVRLPSGDRLTGARMRQLGMLLGMGPGAERLHYILELPHDSPAFLHDVFGAVDFGRNPIYSVIHEACYADGCATRWSAERLLPEAYTHDPELLTGEHVYPWMFENYGTLAPLREAADILAEREWPRLYDADQLARNEVPAAAIIYAEDMYVERALSEETAARIRGLRPWLTNEYEHDGLRVDGARILGRLIDLARGNA